MGDSDFLQSQNRNQSIFHSVELEEDSCKGCTICVTGCPVEAIRVSNGKAHIIEQRCIDCGECIRRCPNHAKQAKSPGLDILSDYANKVALVPPSFYAQFETKYSQELLEQALYSLGFTHLYNVAEDASIISRATIEYLSNKNSIPKPIISSSCPTIIKLIQIRFPTLIEHILPLLPPMELTARRARSEIEVNNTINETSANKKSNIKPTGVFFISPCPAKITVARRPLGYQESEIDSVFSIASLYLPVLNALKQISKANKNSTSRPNSSHDHNNYNPVIWGRECGEAESILHFSNNGTDFSWISAAGIKQATALLESIEDGQCKSFDFAEITACSGGCIGGPLVISTVPIAQATLRTRLSHDFLINKLLPIPKEINWTACILPRSAIKLSDDFHQARKMMEKQEEIISLLPGLDCGSCGAPNCKALAEDIVRGNAKIEDCVTILKAHYEQLLFGTTKGK